MPCPRLRTNLGEIGKIIENLNLIKIWQLEVAALITCDKRFISSREIRGSAFGGDEWFLLQVGSMRTKDESFTILSLLRKSSE